MGLKGWGLGRGFTLLVCLGMLGCGSAPQGQEPSPSPSVAGATPTADGGAPTPSSTAEPGQPTSAHTATPPGSGTPTAAATPSQATPTEVPPTPTATATPITSDCPEGGPGGELHCPVEVRFDARGTPHIYAESEHDAFFTQGWLAAHDRLFQLEAARLQALGRQAELYGSSKIGDDLFMRSLRFLDFGRQELARWEEVHPRELGWLTSYIAGVNAFVEDAVQGRNGAQLPDSFQALGYVPEPYQAEQFLAMDRLFAFSLGPDPGLELTMTVIKLVLSAPVFNDLLRMAPIEMAFTVPDALTPVEDDDGPGGPRPPFPGGGGGGPGQGGRPATWAAGVDPQLAAYLSPLLADQEWRGRLTAAIPHILQMTDRLLGRASNGWVVSGEHTAAGAPILANDAHVGTSLPNQFNQIHVNTADAGGAIDVMGLSIAGLPGVVFGHNRYVGWGVTTGFVDVADLYLEVPSPQNPTGAVMFNGQAVALESREEVLRVRQEDGQLTEQTEVLKWVPHHGPVLPGAALGLPEELIVSVRWAGFQPGTVAGDVLGFNQARHLSRIRAIMDQHTIGAGNWHFASVDGEIAYDPRVRLPVREGLSGINPPWAAMPGTGGYEWSQVTPWIPDEAMPYVYDPPAGFAVTANNDPTGTTADGDPLNDDYYYGATYASGMRARRIDSWLRQNILDGHALTADDMRAFQGDNHSMMAERLIPYLLDAAERRPDLLSPLGAQAVEILADWDHEMSGDAIAPGIYLAWWPRAVFEVFADDAVEELFAWFTGDVGQYLARPLIHFLDVTAPRIDQIDAGGRFPSLSGVNYFDDQTTPEVVETRDEQLLEALEIAVTHLASHYGEDPSGWRWDAMHSLSIGSPEGRWVGGLSRGPYPVEGYGFTVNCTEGVQSVDGMPPGVFSVSKASAYRQVMDFADGRITTTNVILGGQRERGSDPHYDDQIQPWVDHATIPQPFLRAEVEADTEALWWLPEGFPDAEPQVGM